MTMMSVSITSFNALLMVFAAVPLVVLICIYGGDGAGALWEQHRRHKRH
ncbi:hypothetical protein [Lichenihabitans psoromatis]|nr:hypothetical protein [Lichenihabitans psoromatis]